MLNVRLPNELEREVDRLAAEERTTKTQIVRAALERYLESRRDVATSYERGKSLFGRYSSGATDGSTTYKQRVKAKLREKHSR